MEERSKTRWKRKISHTGSASCAISAWPCTTSSWDSVATSSDAYCAHICAISAWVRAEIACSLFFKL